MQREMVETERASVQRDRKSQRAARQKEPACSETERASVQRYIKSQRAAIHKEPAGRIYPAARIEPAPSPREKVYSTQQPGTTIRRNIKSQQVE